MNEQGQLLLPERTLTSELTDQKQTNGDKPWLFKPGQSGNPNGRPVGTISLTSVIKRKMLEIYESPINKEQKKIAIELLADRIMKNAIEIGSERSQEKIWAYLDGNPKDRLELGGDKESLAELTEFFRGVGKKK